MGRLWGWIVVVVGFVVLWLVMLVIVFGLGWCWCWGVLVVFCYLVGLFEVVRLLLVVLC